MGNFLRLSGGVPRSFAESGALTIYDQPLTVISGAPSNTNQVTGPISTGVSITLPQSGTYTGAELEVRLNGQRLEALYDYNYVGTGSGKTQIQMTFNLSIGDRLDFRVDRSP